MKNGFSRNERLIESLCAEIDELEGALHEMTRQRDEWQGRCAEQYRSEEQHHNKMMVGVLNKLLEPIED